MHYDVVGQGDRAILFIHGFGGFGGLWRWQVDHFKGRARVVTVDLPGHGKTPWAPCDLSQMASQIVAVLHEVNVDQVDVVASSFGGLVALSLWDQAPTRVRSLSFVGSLPRFVGTKDFPAGLTVAGIRKLSEQFNGDVGKVLDMFVRSFSTMKERESPQYTKIKELRRQMPLASREALQVFCGILETADLRDILKRVDVPVHFVSGDGDFICPPEAIDALQAHLPQARFDRFEAGHGLFLTIPDQYNRVLSEFLKI